MPPTILFQVQNCSLTQRHISLHRSTLLVELLLRLSIHALLDLLLDFFGRSGGHVLAEPDAVLAPLGEDMSARRIGVERDRS
jgi:hypothetical protein